MAGEITMETLNYRLEQLEKSVSELKNLLVASKLQDKDIETLKTDVSNLETRVYKLEKTPAEKSRVTETPESPPCLSLQRATTLRVKPGTEPDGVNECEWDLFWSPCLTKLSVFSIIE